MMHQPHTIIFIITFIALHLHIITQCYLICLVFREYNFIFFAASIFFHYILSSLPRFFLFRLTHHFTFIIVFLKVQHDWGKKSPRSQQQSINALLQLVALLNHSDLCKFLPQVRNSQPVCACVCLCAAFSIHLYNIIQDEYL